MESRLAQNPAVGGVTGKKLSNDLMKMSKSNLEQQEKLLKKEQALM